jgi:hypothetical protein
MLISFIIAKTEGLQAYITPLTELQSSAHSASRCHRALGTLDTVKYIEVWASLY